MKKIFVTLIAFLFLISIIGCTETNNSQPQKSEIENDTTPQKEEQTKAILVSKNKDIFLHMPTHVTVNSRSISIKGLTTFKTLNIEVLDMNNNILNNDYLKQIQLEESENNWNTIDTFIYFYDKPTTKNGILKVYSTSENYVQLPITFDNPLDNTSSIKVIYPLKEMKQKDFIRVIGYASVFEGSFNYRIKDMQDNILDEGWIQSTIGAPDVGIFAKDIKLNVDSQPVILEVFEISPKDGEELNKINIKINFVS